MDTLIARYMAAYGARTDLSRPAATNPINTHTAEAGRWIALLRPSIERISE